MDNFEGLFIHLPKHRVIICRQCQFAPVPNQIKQHLASHHNRIPAKQRQEIAETVLSLPDLAKTEAEVIYPKPKESPIVGLPVYYDSIRCLAKIAQNRRCQYVCRTIDGIQKHCKREHQWVNQQKRGGHASQKQAHSANKLWETGRACQRFFKVGSWQRYFEVAAICSQRTEGQQDDSKSQFFRQQEDDIQKVERDREEAANRVEGFEDHRSSVLPWLRTTGIVDHMHGLKKDEIRAAITLPYNDDDDSVLPKILEEMDGILQEAHSWCFDGPECMLTWPCRVVLSRFQSSQVELLGNTRAFDPYKGPGALKAYFKLARQFMVYMYRVAASRDHHFSPSEEEGMHIPEDVMEPSSEHLTTWHRIRRLARDIADGQSNTTEIKDAIVKMWILLVSHHTGARRYRSPLLSFCAMLSIELSTGSWMQPGNFSSHLSGIIWVVQLLVFYDSARQELLGNGETLSHVKEFCEKNLQQTVDTPLGEILRWRLLLFHVSQNTVGTHQATWDEDEEVLRYQGTELQMDHIPTLLVSEYQECRRYLYNDLMFASTSIRHMHAAMLKDNMDVHTIGWNFCQHRDNQELLHHSDRALLSIIEQSPQLCKLFLIERSGEQGGIAWRESALASYEATVQEFFKRLAVLAHIEGGPPLREGEFFSITWKNTQRPRSIYIHLKRVMIHTTYDKSQQQRGQLRDNIRFLSDLVGDLLLDYLVYVVPLRQIFLRHSSPKALLSPYLWSKDGKVWSDNKLTRCLENASDRAQIPRLHIANWRQMTVAIVKTKFASQIEVFENDINDEDAEELEQDIRILTKLRNHKTRTANRAYANQTGANFGNVWDGLIRMGLRASTLWQDFWGMSVMVQIRKRPREEAETSRLTKRIAIGIYRPRKPWSSEALLGGLRRLYDDETLEWKSVEQAQALTLVMSWTEQVVIVLPTGAGKSAIFMLPCTLPDAGITILIVPLVSLRCDLLRRLKELRIEHLQWFPGERREAALVLVSVEAASTKDFLTYARMLINQQKLDRIVFEESHLTVTAASYRDSIVDVTDIRELRTQFVYLTATLPPSMNSEFEERNHLLHPKVLRASGNRPNIFYKVQNAKSGDGSLLQQAAGLARAMYSHTMFDATQDKIILYTRTRDEANELAALLRCPVYTAKIGTAEVKSQVVTDWVQSASQPYIVASAAFAEGFDYPHVRVVINVNEPDSLILFAQQSGRGGRDGKPAHSIVLLPSRWQAVSVINAELARTEQSGIRDASLRERREREAMHRYLQSHQCFRISLSEHLDPPQYRRWCMTDDVPCNICKEGHRECVPALEQTDTTEIADELFAGAARIRRARKTEQEELTRYYEDLIAVRGSCLLCRALGRPWDHIFGSCAQRYEVFRERDQTRRRHGERGRQWIQPYTACFWCLNPQIICTRTDSDCSQGVSKCENKDIVLPLCYGIFHSVDGPRMIQERFGRRFRNVKDFFDWLGEETQFGGVKAIQAVRVTAEGLRQFWLY